MTSKLDRAASILKQEFGKLGVEFVDDEAPNVRSVIPKGASTLRVATCPHCSNKVEAMCGSTAKVRCGQCGRDFEMRSKA